jgi:alanine racemase
VWAEIDLDAIRRNTAALVELVDPAALCGVVKANAYGHGAVPCARAVLEGGASSLAVALVEEGIELREAGVDAPILLLSEPPPDAVAEAVAAELTLTLYTAAGIERAADAGRARGRSVPVHVKVDTGMHRVGAAADEAASLAHAVHDSDALELAGVWTHFAVADELDKNAVTEEQLRLFDAVLAALEAKGVDPGVVHAANTAGGLAHPASRRNLVRAGIGIYGYSPMPGAPVDLLPAMALKAEVALVKTVAAGERISYGLRYEVDQRSQIATVPIGYADGVPRRLSAVGGEVLIGGRRRPIAGTVTMDQLMVDCGADDAVHPGAEVVLIGRQAGETITADDWATRLDTISYEIVCGIGPRVPRVYT